MHLFVELVLTAASSLHGASQIFVFILPLLGLPAPGPSWPCGRLWLLRLGYYKLTRPKVVADDWIWIVDHTIQVGPEKCLVIVGVRQCDLPPPGRSLRHADLEPLAVVPVTRSTGTVVYHQLEATSKLTGVPRQIVADAGSDLKRGIHEFCGAHWHTTYTYDVKHKTAALLKRELAQDEAWQRFTHQAAETKCQVQQTPYAGVAPPQQRSKSRYMSLTPLVRWGCKMLRRIQDPTWAPRTSTGEPLDRHQLVEYVGWVEDLQPHLAEWADLVTILNTLTRIITTEGLARSTYRPLRQQLRNTGRTPRTCRVRAELLDWFAREAIGTRSGERLVGSSEVLESVFGKLKQIERTQVSQGFTGLVLSVPAMLSTTTGQVIQQAMEQVSTQEVAEWCRTHIGRSLYVQKQEIASR